MPAEFAAFVGIDWADAQHDICFQAVGSDPRECSQLAHTPAAIAAWARALQERFARHPVAVGLELNNGPLGYALRPYAFLVLFPLNPGTLAKYREAFTPSPAKDDPTDADRPLELLLKQRDTRQSLTPQSPAMRALEPRVAPRRRVVGDTVRLPNRLPSTLTHDFPPARHWFDDTDPTRFCAVLAHWPTLKAAQLARRTTLERFFRTPHVRDVNVIDQRLQAIRSATPLTTDAGGSAPNALLVQALVAPLRGILQAMADCDQAIAQRAQCHPAFPCLAALPGAGAVVAPRLLVACGAQRDRYGSADALHTSAGIAPVTERSGHHTWVHWRWPCPTVRRQPFVAWAAASMRQSFWARISYQQQREQGKSQQAAVRALAFKWIRGRLRCWQHRPPYDASVYLKALKHRGSPLMRNLVHGS